MNKTGSAKRRAKKYYTDKYRKTGLIPGPLLLAGRGILEGRKCSGRPRSLVIRLRKRFVEMVKASVDPRNLPQGTQRFETLLFRQRLDNNMDPRTKA
ncbi:MAG: hypothetical protein JRG74_00015 [Deltaproteobacteria bacterium]|nr:hypothetical protein [Deltaproteobacteria bacterium]